MSYYDTRSYSESARRYIELIESPSKQKLECSMLLCIATRALAGHRDALQATIEAGDCESRFRVLKRVWTSRIPPTIEIDAATRSDSAGGTAPEEEHPPTKARIPICIDWRFGMPDAVLNQESWPDQQPTEYADSVRASAASWEMFLSHTRNSLSHGLVWWTSRTPARKLPKDIHGLVLASEDRRTIDQTDDGIRYPWRSCSLSVDTFRTLLLHWLRQVDASGLPWSPPKIMSKLYQDSRKTA